MKKLIMYVIGLTLLPFCYLRAWDVSFVEDSPNNCSTMPSSYIVTSSNPQIQVKFEITCIVFPIVLCPSDSFTVDIYLEGNPSIHLAHYEHLERNEVITRTVQLQNSYFSVNTDAVLRVVARPNGESEIRSSLGFFRAYLNNSTNPITGFTALTSGTSSSPFSQQCNFFARTPCHLPGLYPVDRYRVDWNISGNFENKNIILDYNMCMGYTPDNNPNAQWFWGQVVNKTNSSATLRTYVYKVYITESQWEWWPSSPDKAAIMYKSVDVPTTPIISHFTQNPFPISAAGTIKCHVSQGGGTLIYHWSDVNRPANILVSYNNQYAYITRTGLDNNGGNSVMTEGPTFELRCYVTNEVGSSTLRTFKPSYTPLGGGGCPYILAYDTAVGFRMDNNILHRAEFEENYGFDIKDVYKLNVRPSIEDSLLSLAIKETESDQDYFDKFRLYAIDHSIWDRVVITENNDIAIYDVRTVISPEEAYRNSSEITSYVQYDTISPLRRLIHGDPNDSINANYDEQRMRDMFSKLRNNRPFSRGSTIDSLAIIAEIEADPLDGPIPTPDPIKTPAGNISIETDSYTIESPFASRESLAPIVIPFSTNQEAANVVNIKWFRDYQIQFLSVISIFYEDFTKTEIPLIGAWHSINGDVLNQLNYTDNEYAELDSSGYITLTFRDIPPPPSGKIRDYVIEVDGHYLLEGSSNIVRRKKSAQQEIVEKKNEVGNLIGNYPNPFNPTTNIAFEISNPSFVTLTIYDVLGKEVITLVDEFRNAGRHEVIFNGDGFASGIYFYKIKAGDFEHIKQMVLIK